jgi:hypothetical protein
LIRPPTVRKGAGPVEVTISGYGLQGAIVAGNPGVSVTVLSSTPTSIRFSLTVSDSARSGPTTLTLRDVLGRSLSVDFTIEERLPGDRFGGTNRKPSNKPPGNKEKSNVGPPRASGLNQHASRVGGQQ